MATSQSVFGTVAESMTMTKRIKTADLPEFDAARVRRDCESCGIGRKLYPDSLPQAQRWTMHAAADQCSGKAAGMIFLSFSAAIRFQIARKNVGEGAANVGTNHEVWRCGNHCLDSPDSA